MASWRGGWLDRSIERELTVGLSPRRRARLHQRLRQDPQARARYDRAVSALRVLEGDGPLAPSELEVVGRWLAADWGAPADAVDAAAPAGARRWWPGLVAVLVAAAVVLLVSPLGDPGAWRPWSRGLDRGWQARGPGSSGALALEALCGPEREDGVAPPLVARDCDARSLLGFGYCVGPVAEGGVLTLFGVDAQGDPMFYAPTPVDEAAVRVVADRWRPLPLAVRLSVNHAPGSLRVYGVVAPTAATPDEIRAWVHALTLQSPAREGTPPWIERVPVSSLRRLCPASTSCHAAELQLTLRP